MMRVFILLGAALLATSSAVWAVHKCPDANGQVVYQDKPCPRGDGKELQLKESSRGMDGGSYYDGGYSSSGYSGGSYSGGSNTIYTGPRGGRYTITSGGNKSYLPRR